MNAVLTASEPGVIRGASPDHGPFGDSRRDTVKGLVLSVALHCVLIGVGGWLWTRPAAYGVTAGESAMEVELIAAPAPAIDPVAAVIPELEPEPPPAAEPEFPLEPAPIEPASIEVPAHSDPVEPVSPEPRPLPPVIGDGSSRIPGYDAVTQSASAGAQVTARPNYLKNPAPRYPEASRKNSEEGLVLLAVEVSAAGRATEVTLAQSSGYGRLDRAALDAVRRWTFEPARLGPLPAASTVQVPVRFRLSDQN